MAVRLSALRAGALYPFPPAPRRSLILISVTVDLKAIAKLKECDQLKKKKQMT
jgi:hypothetical protein